MVLPFIQSVGVIGAPFIVENIQCVYLLGLLLKRQLHDMTSLLFLPAASCVTSETVVPRDIFYDGNTIAEKATIVMRMAPTFLRYR